MMLPTKNWWNTCGALGSKLSGLQIASPLTDAEKLKLLQERVERLERVLDDHGIYA
jgi:hypothetical protein